LGKTPKVTLFWAASSLPTTASGIRQAQGNNPCVLNEKNKNQNDYRNQRNKFRFHKQNSSAVWSAFFKLPLKRIIGFIGI
jgi:hypothetical protein